MSESPRLHTGFGRVAHELLTRLAAGGRFDLALLGWSAEPPPDEEHTEAYLTYPPGPAPWDLRRIDQVIDDFGPAVLVTSGPLSKFRRLPNLRGLPFLQWIGYAFFEADPLPPEDRDTLAHIDQTAVPSAWCRRVITQGQPPHQSRHIPLGVDTAVFRPLPDRHRLRSDAGLADRFVVGCVARNEFRKQIPLLIKAFARFAQHHPEALLYLHMDPDDSGWPLVSLLHRCRIADRTAFTRGLAGAIGVESSLLNQIYNLFDVMVLPTMGEAFGLTILEAMAAGVPVLATDCSAVPELLASGGGLIRASASMTMPWDGAEYAVADEADIVAKLELLHRSPDLRRQHAARGRKVADRMTWERAAASWTRLLNETAAASWFAARGDRSQQVHTVQV